MEMQELFAKFKKLIKNKNAIYIAAALVLGILLMCIPALLPDAGENTESVGMQTDKTEYGEMLEKKLLEVISKIQGVGETSVMVTIETRKEYVYAYEERKNTNISTDKGSKGEIRDANQEDIQKSLIVVNDGSGKETPVLIKEIAPKVQGVAIVCEGGDDPIVKSKIVEAVTTVLNIPSNRVCVIKS